MDIPTSQLISFTNWIHSIDVRNHLTIWLQLLFVFVTTLITASLFAMIGVDPHHDGVMLKTAIDFSQGIKLFTESLTYYGPLSNILQSLAISIFGEHLISIRLLTSFFYAGISILLWLIWSRFLPQWLTTVACIIWLLLAPYYFMTFLPWSSVYALFFQMLATYFVILFIEQNVLNYLFLAGLNAALTFWSRQPIGMLLIVSLMMFLFIYNLVTKSRLFIKNISYLMAGFMSASMIFLIWIIANGAVEDWWIQQFKFIYILFFEQQLQGDFFSNLQKIFSHLFPNNVFPNSEFIWKLLPAISLFLLFDLAINWAYKKSLSTQQLTILVLIFVSIASWAQYFPITCNRHVYWAATPMVGLLVYTIWYSIRNEIVATKLIIVSVLLLLTFYAPIKYRVELGYAKLNKDLVYSNVPLLLGIKLSSSESIKYQKINDVIKEFENQQPNNGVINIGNDELYRLFAKRQEKNKIYTSIYGRNLYPNSLKELQKLIQNQRPLVIDGGNIITFYDTTIDGFDAAKFLSSQSSAKPILYCISTSCSMAAEYDISLNNFNNNATDLVGRNDLLPNQETDTSIDVTFNKINDTTDTILNFIRVHLFNEQDKIVGAWDTRLQILWIVGVFKDGHLLNKTYTDNLNFLWKDNETLHLQVNGNAVKGKRITFDFYYNSGHLLSRELALH